MGFVDKSLGVDEVKISEHVTECEFLEVENKVTPFEAICAYSELIKLELLRFKTFHNIEEKTNDEALDGILELLRSALGIPGDEEKAGEDGE